MSSEPEQAASIPGGQPAWWLRSVLLSLVATAGFFYVNIMSALVDGLETGAGYSAAQAGAVGSANVYGASAGALLAIALVARLRWRRATALLLVGLVLCDLASTSPMAPGELMALRALHGMLGGLCVGIVYSVMGRMPAPDRAFGVLLVLQYGLGGLGVMMLPRLVPRFGTPVLFLTMAALAGCALISLLALKDGPPSLSTSAPARAAMRPGNGTPRVIGILLGLFFFQAGNMAIGAFLVGLGTHAGLDRLLVTQALGWSTWIGILGAAAVALLGTGQRRFVLLLGAFLFSILSNGAFAWSRWPGVYFGANVLSSVSWSFVVPVLFGMAAESNTSGRMATVAGLASKLGLATGPLVGGFVLGFGYPALIGLSLGALGVAALSALLAARSCRVASSHDDDLSGQSGSWKD